MKRKQEEPITPALPPPKCLLCGEHTATSPAGFQQLYPQEDADPIPLDWWECGACKAWFVYPVPEPAVIERYWSTVAWLDPKQESDIATGKGALNRRILNKLSSCMAPARLLDFGCNFGRFLCMAREAGWTATGFEPNKRAAEVACSNGFDVHCGWFLEHAVFPDEYFSAIIATDSFYYAWDPSSTLRLFYRLLKPGGVLAMRLSNKRVVLEIVRALTPSGLTRDATISGILQAQFHSISIDQLTKILRRLGFDRIAFEPRAMTVRAAVMTAQMRAAYLVADLIHIATLSRVNLSPGVLLYARKN